MHLYIASDHAGLSLQESLVPFLESLGHVVDVCGSGVQDPQDDYPDVVAPLAEKVANDAMSFGIVIGASGQGEAIAANRVRGVRAAVFYGNPVGEQTDAEGNILNLVQSMRAHNNANVLSLGARFISPEEAQAAVLLFLNTPFSQDERHIRRIAKLDA